MSKTPHKYFEEDNLHGLLISEQRRFQETLNLLESFLPYVDNWSTCDLIQPKAFKELTQAQRIILFDYIQHWIDSSHEYTVRFGIEMLLVHYLQKGYDQAQLHAVANIKLKTYYVDIMNAWYFATAPADHYDDVMRILKSNSLRPWIHNKTIQKARESLRVSQKHKIELKSLTRPSGNKPRTSSDMTPATRYV